MEFAVIGGTGFYSLSEGQECDRIEVETRYGVVEVERARMGESEIAFVARHGRKHSVPPHRVNYRGNIAALRELGVKNILASAAVGSISAELPPGSLVVLTQFLDFTRGRASTFFDGDGGGGEARGYDGALLRAPAGGAARGGGGAGRESSSRGDVCVRGGPAV